MSTVAEVLHDLGYRSSEEQVANSLRELLRPARVTDGVNLTGSDEEFLKRYSGVSPASERALAESDAQSAARAAVEAARLPSRSQVAELLRVDATRVSHQTAAGNLYAYQLGRVRPAYPAGSSAAAARCHICVRCSRHCPTASTP